MIYARGDASLGEGRTRGQTNRWLFISQTHTNQCRKPNGCSETNGTTVFHADRQRRDRCNRIAFYGRFSASNARHAVASPERAARNRYGFIAWKIIRGKIPCPSPLFSDRKSPHDPWTFYQSRFEFARRAVNRHTVQWSRAVVRHRRTRRRTIESDNVVTRQKLWRYSRFDAGTTNLCCVPTT